MKIPQSKIIGLLLCLLTTGCVVENHQAPVINGWKLSSGQHSRYIVQRGDTLYSVAWAFDMNFRELARLNHLTPPYSLKHGQTLVMSSKDSWTKTAARATANVPRTVAINQPLSRPVLPKTPLKTTQIDQPAPNPLITENSAALNNWLWPTQGQLLSGFHPVPGGNKGINIVGKMGQPILAAAGGKVVYCGSGLPGYGNLIIVKHDEHYLSAYANNKILLVKEGDKVSAGQTIAQMGADAAGKADLHFEIRLNGKPVNPLLLLKKMAYNG